MSKVINTKTKKQDDIEMKSSSISEDEEELE